MIEKALFPLKGLSEDQLLNQIEQLKEQDVKWESGKMYGFVYHPGEKIAKTVSEIAQKFSHDNALNPLRFSSLRKFETEIVAIAAELLNGNDEVVGNVTSGGTESILMAVKTARDINRKTNPEIRTPELIIPESAHPAFLKACHYLDVQPVMVPVREDKRADVEKIKQAVNQNTILIACSAPSYPHGVIDPVEEIAKLAVEKNILFHVDACLGGFVLPFMKDLGYNIPSFDFDIQGVTSISLDPHKYGYAPKGISVILYRNKELRKKQFFIYPNWSGGIFASPGLSGTRGGGVLAGTWAILKLLGREGYQQMVKSVMTETSKIINGIESIPNLVITGHPDMSVFSFTSVKGDIFNIADALEEKGWFLNRLQFPDSLQMTISAGNIGKADEFLTELKNIVSNRRQLMKDKQSSDFQVAMAKGLSKVLPSNLFKKITNQSISKSLSDGNGGSHKQAAMYGIAASLGNRGNVNDLLENLLDKLYRI